MEAAMGLSRYRCRPGPFVSAVHSCMFSVVNQNSEKAERRSLLMLLRVTQPEL
jgi:hypothetical protein